MVLTMRVLWKLGRELKLVWPVDTKREELINLIIARLRVIDNLKVSSGKHIMKPTIRGGMSNGAIQDGKNVELCGSYHKNDQKVMMNQYGRVKGTPNRNRLTRQKSGANSSSSMKEDNSVKLRLKQGASPMQVSRFRKKNHESRILSPKFEKDLEGDAKRLWDCCKRILEEIREMPETLKFLKPVEWRGLKPPLYPNII